MGEGDRSRIVISFYLKEKGLEERSVEAWAARPAILQLEYTGWPSMFTVTATGIPARTLAVTTQ